MPSFEFERDAIMGEWPTAARTLSSDCDESVAPADWSGEGTTTIAEVNASLDRVTRLNGEPVYGRIEGHVTTLESTVSMDDGQSVQQSMRLEFTSPTRFVATTTMVFRSEDDDATGCTAVVEDVGSR
jgi:hypothetical protein